MLQGTGTDEARLDFGVVRDGTGPIWVGRNGDFPDTKLILVHRVRNPVPFV